jgi:hypothetical protein
MARMLRLMHQHEPALAIQHEVRLQLQDSGVADGVVFEEIGECLSALGRDEEAETYFRKAYDLLADDQWLADNQPARIKRLKTMGNAKVSGGKP